MCSVLMASWLSKLSKKQKNKDVSPHPYFFVYITLLRIHIGMNLVDRACSWIERHVGDIALEESATT